MRNYKRVNHKNCFYVGALWKAIVIEIISKMAGRSPFWRPNCVLCSAPHSRIRRWWGSMVLVAGRGIGLRPTPNKKIPHPKGTSPTFGVCVFKTNSNPLIPLCWGANLVEPSYTASSPGGGGQFSDQILGYTNAGWGWLLHYSVPHRVTNMVRHGWTSASNPAARERQTCGAMTGRGIRWWGDVGKETTQVIYAPT